MDEQSTMNLILRAATADEQPAITRMVRAARLNPLGLNWPNFVVIEAVTTPNAETPQIIGIGQLRPRGGDAQELASLVVAERYQGRGLGVLLVHTLMGLATGPLYLMCESRMIGYYRRFGFVELSNPRIMPRAMARFYRIGRVLAAWIERLTGEAHYPTVMALPHTRSTQPGSSNI